MDFRNIIFSAIFLSSTPIYADTIGWGNQPTQPTRPAQPTRPTQPTQPTIPSQPSLPSRPSAPPAQPNFPGSSDPWGNNNGSIILGGQQARSIEENIQRYFYDQNALDLLLDQYIVAQLQGLRIRDITVIASTQNGQGMASLVLNGQSIENSKLIGREMASYTFKVDPFANIVGQSLRSIQLSMRGQFYIDKVIFNLIENNPGPTRPSERPRVEVVRQQLNEHIQQEGGLELFRMFNLGLERQGQAIRRVTVVARSDRGLGLASLLINNQQASSSQNISYNSTRLTFELNPQMRIGREIQGLRLYFRGNISIDEVSIEIEKQDGNNGPFPPSGERRFEQMVNQRLYDTAGVDLRNLMQIPSRFDERIVDSVELFLRDSDMGVRLKLCQTSQDRYQSVNCTAPTTLYSGAQIVRLSAFNFSKLRDVTLSSRMGMIDIDRIAINFR